MNLVNDIPITVDDFDHVSCIVEIPKDTNTKYEYDEKLNIFNKELILKNFSDKQIKVEKKHIDYIIKRIDRSYEKISQFILTLDKYSLKKGSPFSLKLIKEVLKMI